MRKGFALIELLLVLALIGVLTAIAVPRFTEHQYRTKLARVKSDMRTLATALEAYKTDRGAYPWDGQTSAYSPSSPAVYYGTDIQTQFGAAHFNNMLTTPVAYVTSAYWQDPYSNTRPFFSGYRFVNIEGTYNPAYPPYAPFYQRYVAVLGAWQILSAGPDSVTGPMSCAPYGLFWVTVPYDPTNGVVSSGDIVWTHRSPEGVYPPPAS